CHHGRGSRCRAQGSLTARCSARRTPRAHPDLADCIHHVLAPTRTSTCRNFATISSGLYRFLAIAVLLDVKDIPQALQWGWITGSTIKKTNPPSSAGHAALFAAQTSAVFAPQARLHLRRARGIYA